MGITRSSEAVTIHNLRYSAFLGMLYVSCPDVDALIDQAKAQVGEAEVKKGYQGTGADTASGKALAFLRERDVSPIAIQGILTSVQVKDHEADGRVTPYLKVGMKDGNDRFYLSVDLGQAGAQMLARKLANAEAGVETTLKLFATWQQRPGASRPYADHGATLKQSGKEVPGVDPQTALVPAVNSALEALKVAAPDIDEKTLSNRRAKVTLDYHRGLLEAVNDRFATFYATRGTTTPEAEAEPASAQAAA